MKQRFFTNTVVSNFIKALVYNTPIPHIKTMNSKSYLIKDNDYLYKDKIIHCTKTGMFKPPKIDSGYTGYYKNGELKISKTDITNNGYVKLSKSSSNVVDNLIFGQYYPKHTELYCSKHSYYDSETHEHLGELLRCYRDIYDINLMPYYNCVSGRYQPDIVIGKEKSGVVNSAKVVSSKYDDEDVDINFNSDVFVNYVNNYERYKGIKTFNFNYDTDQNVWTLNGTKIDNLTDFGITYTSQENVNNIVIECEFKDKPALYKRNNSDFKTYRIPIKFNTTYTLALDCNSKVVIAPALLSKNHIINSVFYNIESGSEELKLNDEMMLDNGYTFNSLSFTQPVTLGINTLNKEHASILQKYEKYLYLLIQIPKDNNSSIVLLEGDYTDVETIHIFNGEELDNLSDLDLSEVMTSGLSLLQLNDHITYPFADRLIEYLLLGVICSRDEIFKNIERIQEVFYPMEFIPQVWDNKLRNAVYLNFQRIGLATRIDLNGFVDSNTEALIKKLS